jgi:hypothetical protein
MRSASLVFFAVLLFQAGTAAGEEPAATPDEPAQDLVDESEVTVAARKATTDEKAAVEEEVEKYFRRNGYTPVSRGGEKYYCRDEAPFGSRVKKQVCITEEIAKRQREDARRTIEEKFGKLIWTEG